MNKADIMKKLDELNVEYDPEATKAELEALLPEVEEEVDEEKEEVDEKEEKSGKNEVTVTWNGGSRVYSKAVHGKGFKALAKEFAEKHGGKVK